MPSSPEAIALGTCPPLSQSQDQLSRTAGSESTVFSLSRSESLWTSESVRSRTREIYWYPIHLMATGGSILACGTLISGFFFAGHNRKVTLTLGPALLSIGLMVLVVGVVLIPITKKNLQPAVKKPFSYYRQPVFNL